MRLSHLDEKGSARMVDVSGKPPVRRTAKASARVHMSRKTIRLIREGLLQKGDVLAVARIAGICAAKKTPDLIPLCHGIRLDSVSVDLKLLSSAVAIETEAICADRTGVEMEAITAAAVAAITIYDMCKAVDKKMTIGDIRLVSKTKSA